MNTERGRVPQDEETFPIPESFHTSLALAGLGGRA